MRSFVRGDKVKVIMKAYDQSDWVDKKDDNPNMDDLVGSGVICEVTANYGDRVLIRVPKQGIWSIDPNVLELA